MRDFCKASSCLRSIMNNHFRLCSVDIDQTKTVSKCQCCSPCIESCKCESCIPLECHLDFSVEMHLPDMPENSEISVRQFDDEKIKLLRGNLLDEEMK